MSGVSAKTYMQREMASDYIPNWVADNIDESASKPARHLRSVSSSHLNSAETEQPAPSSIDSSQSYGHSPKIIRNSLILLVLLLLVSAGSFKLNSVKRIADDVTGKGTEIFSSTKDFLLKKKPNTLTKNNAPVSQSEQQPKSGPNNNYKFRADTKAKNNPIKKAYKKKSKGHITSAPLDTGSEDLKNDLKNSFKQGGWQ